MATTQPVTPPGARRRTPRLRRPPLALRNVVHGGGRSLVAVVGMALAVVMVLLQLGFLEAVKVTAAVNYDQLEFDLAVVSAEFEQFYAPGRFPRERLTRARSVPGVAAARPLFTRMDLWRCPAFPPSDPRGEPAAKADAAADALSRWWLGAARPRPLQRRALLLLGVDLDDDPFRGPIRAQVEAAAARLRQPGRVLLNDRSNPDFGWDAWPGFRGWELGTTAVEVVGPFSLTRSFGADGAVLASDLTFARTAGLADADALVTLGLVTLRPGTDPEAAAEALRRRLTPDVRVVTRAELYRQEADYWVGQTATGKIFTFGVFLTMVVAAVVIYQALANDIRDHLPEYATLKAVGYGDGFLARVIQTQALVYVAACFVPAAVVSAGVYRVTETLANIPMVLTAGNLATALAVALATGQLAGLLSLRKLRQADPAELFG